MIKNIFAIVLAVALLAVGFAGGYAYRSRFKPFLLQCQGGTAYRMDTQSGETWVSETEHIANQKVAWWRTVFDESRGIGKVRQLQSLAWRLQQTALPSEDEVRTIPLLTANSAIALWSTPRKDRSFGELLKKYDLLPEAEGQVLVAASASYERRVGAASTLLKDAYAPEPLEPYEAWFQRAPILESQRESTGNADDELFWRDVYNHLNGRPLENNRFIREIEFRTG